MRICLNVDLLTWLDETLTKEMDVLEYGSGASTPWLAERARSVHTREHNPIWADKIREDARENVTFLVTEDRHAYAAPPMGQTFDLILVDGIERLHCLAAAAGVVKRPGWILLDDCHREEMFRRACRLLGDPTRLFLPGLNDLDSVHASGRFTAVWTYRV